MLFKSLNIKNLIITVVFLFLFCVNNFATVANEGGYANKLSVFKNQNIKFYISTSYASYQIKIYKVGGSGNPVFISPVLPGSIQYFPSDAYKNGCNWNKSFEMIIPSSWEPGVYRATFPISKDYYENSDEIIFTVKALNLGSFSKIAVILTVSNWNAYNNFGGKSLYNYSSTNSQKANKVSFERPFTYSSLTDFHIWTEKLINWLEDENQSAEYITNVDLYQNPNLLSNYEVVINVGHDEYVTLQERDQVESFINSGGRYMNLGGNTYWWQVRFEDNGRTVVCYKDPEKDPMLGVNDDIVTTRWYDYPVYNPETKITGVTFREGGVVNYEDGSLPKSKGYGDFAVYNSHYWVFKNTGLKDGDEFGYDDSIVGVEVDGNDFSWVNGIPTVTGNDSAPTNFRILGLSPADNREDYENGHGVMGLYFTQNGGAVFNASTLNWAKGLPTDLNVQKITRNILNQFLKNSFPPEITSWTPGVAVPKTINHESVFINDRDNLSLTESSMKFSITATDPKGFSVNYMWNVNGTNVSNSNASNFTFFNTGPSGVYVIKAFAFNSSDTAEISWKVTTVLNPSKYSVSGKVLYDNNINSPMKNVNVKLTSLNNGNFLNSTTDNNGEFIFNNVEAGNYNLTVSSDTQFPENYINATDALIVLRYFAKLISLNPLQIKAANVDNAGDANATDALIIVKRFAKQISEFPAGNWSFESKDIEVTNSDLTLLIIKGIAVGDVDGSVVIN